MQEELFKDIPSLKKSKFSFKISTLGLKRFSFAFENILLLAIVFVMALIVSFSLGIEKGKSMATSTKSETLNMPKFTVQIASFTKEESAINELKKLRSKDFSPCIIARDKFLLLCVGSFSEKKEALKLEDELKNTYKDCFVREF